MPSERLVVFSHLRWDSVFQRPHHLLSRLARRTPVLFVEEPIHEPALSGSWEIRRPIPGLTVARPRTKIPRPGYHPEQIPLLTSMTRRLLLSQRVEDAVAWLYTPLAYPIAMAIEPSVLVYDCMDQLAAFLGAPPEMELREAALLRDADVVFTGGPSLHRAKRKLSRVVRCFPSSVDAAHFREPAPEPEDQRGIPGPKLGFYGVLDERFDGSLVDAVAHAHPEWQVVLIGPVVKIDPASLPHRANIHYLGQRSYAELPAYLHGWDACLLPFARNAATEFISPTKTLEYMAAEKPIVTTPIRDVVDLHGDIVYCGATADEFVRACEAALCAPLAERAFRAARMRDRLATTSWDATVAAMEQEIAGARRRARWLGAEAQVLSLPIERAEIELVEERARD